MFDLLLRLVVVYMMLGQAAYLLMYPPIYDKALMRTKGVNPIVWPIDGLSWFVLQHPRYFAGPEQLITASVFTVISAAYMVYLNVTSGLPTLTFVPHWLLIFLLSVMCSVTFRRRRKSTPPQDPTGSWVAGMLGVPIFGAFATLISPGTDLAGVLLGVLWLALVAAMFVGYMALRGYMPYARV